ILIYGFGIPEAFEVFLFIFGAVIGFMLLAGVAYRGILKTVKKPVEEKLLVLRMIHFVAALGTVGISYVLTENLTNVWAFTFTGINATVSYNLLLLAEDYISREIVHGYSRYAPGRHGTDY
ncbi:MAG: hypothetical protein ABEJ72_03685, partial [Candidatus Aenigmatarchaeota archaeon]